MEYRVWLRNGPLGRLAGYLFGAGAVGPAHARLVSLSLCLWLAVFVTKAAMVFTLFHDPDLPPQLHDGRSLVAFGHATACCLEDAAVAVVFLGLGALALRWRRSPLVQACLYLAALFALLFVVINAHVFARLRCFVKLGHLEALASLGFERSILDAATPAVRLTLVMAPLLTLAAHLGLMQIGRSCWLAAARLVCRPGLAVTVVLLLMLGARAAERQMFRDSNGDFARNPHLVLLRSVLHPPVPEADDLPSDPSDFLPGRPQPGTGIASARPANIVLIVIESWGAPYLDLCGGAFDVTPQLRRLRDRGIVFENFYATSNLSAASGLPLFGSIYNDPRDIATAAVHRSYPIPNAGSWLKKHGYRTYFLGAGGRASWETPARMVDSFVKGHFDLGRDARHTFWKERSNPECFFDDGYLDAEVFADARRLLRQADGQPFFLMVWNYATHFPYRPYAGPQSFPEESFPPVVQRDPQKKEEFVAYLRSLWCADALVGELYAELAQLGLADNTLFVVTGDHGESWGQHGHFMHSTSLYEEEIHVPLVMLHPAVAPLGPRRDIVGSHIDLWPTIMDVCGLPSDPRWQGRSLLGDDASEERRAYFYMHRTWIGVRAGKYKYLWDRGKQRKRLYDLEADPGERCNLAPQYPHHCAALHRRVLDWMQFQARLARERLADAQH